MGRLTVGLKIARITKLVRMENINRVQETVQTHVISYKCKQIKRSKFRTYLVHFILNFKDAHGPLSLTTRQ